MGWARKPPAGSPRSARWNYASSETYHARRKLEGPNATNAIEPRSGFRGSPCRIMQLETRLPRFRPWIGHFDMHGRRGAVDRISRRVDRSVHEPRATDAHGDDRDQRDRRTHQKCASGNHRAGPLRDILRRIIKHGLVHVLPPTSAHVQRLKSNRSAAHSHLKSGWVKATKRHTR